MRKNCSFNTFFQLLFLTALLTSAVSLEKAINTPMQKDPVKWDFNCVQVGKNEFEIHAKAVIEPGWNIGILDKEDLHATRIIFFSDVRVDYLDTPQCLQWCDKYGGSRDDHGDLVREHYKDSVLFVQSIRISDKVDLISLKGSVVYTPYASYTHMQTCMKVFNVPVIRVPAIKRKSSANSLSEIRTKIAVPLPRGLGEDGSLRGWKILRKLSEGSC